ncbi:RDD family protein [Halapricum sp. CBA1109]|uniref:RDD family protein n=1 Tax=Halapricum sp. CBA1109 TaxID=2668068 RepID=UPI001E2AC8DF|nr:RDD family protein [Halapricum sp. CBA1109]
MADGGNRRGGNQSQRGGQGQGQRGGQQRNQPQQGGQRGGQQPNQPRQGGQAGHGTAQGGHGAVQGGGRGNWDGSGYPRAPTRDDTDVVGSRIIAQIVDSIVGTVLALVTIFVFGAIGGAAGGSSGAGIAAIGFLAAILVFVGYFFLLEGLWDGYTVGKKVFGIKVVKEDGSECGVGTSFIRNLLRIIDYLPVYSSSGSS